MSTSATNLSTWVSFNLPWEERRTIQTATKSHINFPLQFISHHDRFRRQLLENILKTQSKPDISRECYSSILFAKITFILTLVILQETFKSKQHTPDSLPRDCQEDEVLGAPQVPVPPLQALGHRTRDMVNCDTHRPQQQQQQQLGRAAAECGSCSPPAAASCQEAAERRGGASCSGSASSCHRQQPHRQQWRCNQ